MRKPSSVLTELKQLLEVLNPKAAPLPTLKDVNYTEPNPGGKHRKCSNCIFWFAKDQRCTIHDHNLTIKSDNVCGRHVFGKPTDKWVEFPGIAPVDGRYSGLKRVPEGVACENCTYFSKVDDEDGVCSGVLRSKHLAHVRPLGGCSRWEQKGAIVSRGEVDA